MTYRLLKPAGLVAALALASASLAACGESAAPRSNGSAQMAAQPDAPEDKPLLEETRLARDTAQNTVPAPPGYAASAGAAAPDVDLDTLALSEGEWFMKGNKALFGPPESEALFTLACEPGSGEVSMTRSIALEQGETVQLGLHTDTANAAGTWRDAGDVMPIAVASLPASDPVFSSISDAERFAVTADGAPMMVLPVTDGLRATLEACA